MKFEELFYRTEKRRLIFQYKLQLEYLAMQQILFENKSLVEELYPDYQLDHIDQVNFQKEYKNLLTKLGLQSHEFSFEYFMEDFRSTRDFIEDLTSLSLPEKTLGILEKIYE